MQTDLSKQPFAYRISIVWSFVLPNTTGNSQCNIFVFNSSPCNKCSHNEHPFWYLLRKEQIKYTLICREARKLLKFHINKSRFHFFSAVSVKGSDCVAARNSPMENLCFLVAEFWLIHFTNIVLLQRKPTYTCTILYKERYVACGWYWYCKKYKLLKFQFDLFLVCCASSIVSVWQMIEISHYVLWKNLGIERSHSP
jgi:hypothetical protein